MTLGIAQHNVMAFFAAMHASEFHIQGVRLHFLPNQPSKGFQAYTNMLSETTLQKAARQMEVSPDALADTVFGVSTDWITSKQF